MKLTGVDNCTGLAVCGGRASGVGSGGVEQRPGRPRDLPWALPDRGTGRHPSRSSAGPSQFVA